MACMMCGPLCSVRIPRYSQSTFLIRAVWSLVIFIFNLCMCKCKLTFCVSRQFSFMVDIDTCLLFEHVFCESLPSVLWRCWLGGRKGIRPLKILQWWGAGMVICRERDADLHMAQLMPLKLTVSCCSTIQIGFVFLVLAHPGSSRKKAIKRCVCVLWVLLRCFHDVPVLICLRLHTRNAHRWQC